MCGFGNIPNVNKLLLIFNVSIRVSPVAFDSLTFSLPNNEIGMVRGVFEHSCTTLLLRTGKVDKDDFATSCRLLRRITSCRQLLAVNIQRHYAMTSRRVFI